MNTNNANTGMASVNPEFNWYQSSSAPHVEGYKVSGPDYSIPPTPASSYSNLHVVLDTVHPSTETITRSVVLPSQPENRSGLQSFPSSASRSVPSSSQTAPWSSPRSDPTPALRPLSDTSSRDVFISQGRSVSGDVPIGNNRLDGVPQPSSRAIPESVDPEQPGARSSEALTSLKSEIAPLPQDPLFERTDRELPASVDIPLIDESIQQKPVSNGQWDQVGRDISDKKWRLKHFSQLDQFENEERQWRMSRAVDPIWSGRWHNVGLEFLRNVEPLGFSGWLSALKNKTSGLIDSAKDLATDALSGPAWTEPIRSQKLAFGSKSDAEPIDFTFKSWRAPSSILKMEEEERQWRMQRPVDPILSGKWFRIGREFQSNIGSLGWSNWLSNLKNRIVRRSSDAVESIENAAFAVKDKASDVIANNQSMVNSAIESIENAAITAKDIAVDSLYTSANVGAALARTGSDIISDAFDSAKSAIGTATSMGSDLVEAAVDKYEHMNVVKAPDSLIANRGLDDSYDKVDFTFKKSRTPQWILNAEEEERQWRMSRAVDPVISGLWYKIGAELKNKFALKSGFVASAVSNLAERATESISEIAKPVEAAKEQSGGWAGLFGSIAHSVANSTSNLVSAATHSHLAESAKASISSMYPSSSSSFDKAEEAERVRRMNEKADPMMLARLGRVQDELLHTVKSV